MDCCILFLSRRAAPGFGVVHHSIEFPTNVAVPFSKSCTFVACNIAASNSCAQPVAGFLRLTVSIRQLTPKMSRVLSFSPGLANVSTDRPGGSASLIREREPFFGREALRQLKDFLLRIKCKLIDIQIGNLLRQCHYALPFTAHAPQPTFNSLHSTVYSLHSTFPYDPG